MKPHPPKGQKHHNLEIEIFRVNRRLQAAVGTKMASVEPLLTSAASVFGLRTSYNRTSQLKERLAITKRHLKRQRFWRDKHNSRRFIDEKEEEVRAIGSASIYLALFSCIALFQLPVKSLNLLSPRSSFPPLSTCTPPI